MTIKTIRKLTALFLSALLCLTVTLPVYAADTDKKDEAAAVYAILAENTSRWLAKSDKITATLELGDYYIKNELSLTNGKLRVLERTSGFGGTFSSYYRDNVYYTDSTPYGFSALLGGKCSTELPSVLNLLDDPELVLKEQNEAGTAYTVSGTYNAAAYYPLSGVTETERVVAVVTVDNYARIISERLYSASGRGVGKLTVSVGSGKALSDFEAEHFPSGKTESITLIDSETGNTAGTLYLTPEMQILCDETSGCEFFADSGLTYSIDSYSQEQSTNRYSKLTAIYMAAARSYEAEFLLTATSDIAGCLEPASDDMIDYGFVGTLYSAGSAGVGVERERIMLDLGDSISGGSYSIADDGATVVQAMADAGVTAAVPGERELLLGAKLMKKYGNTLNYLAGNVRNADGSALFNSYYTRTIDAGGKRVTIGFFGVFDDELAKTLPAPVREQYQFEDAAVYSVSAAAFLRNELQCDIVVGLTHGEKESVLATAASVCGVTLWLYGHSDAYDAQTVKTPNGTTFVASCEPSLHQLLETSVKIDGKDLSLFCRSHAYDPSTDGCNPTDNAVTDLLEARKSLYRDLAAKTSSYLRIAYPSDATSLCVGETTLGNVVADSYRYVTDADVAAECAGSITNGLYSGKVSSMDIYGVLSRGDALYTVTIEGSELLKIFEHSVDAMLENYAQYKSGSHEYDSDSALQLSGAIVCFYSEPSGNNVDTVYIGDEELDEDALYKLAVPDYLLKTIGQYAEFSASQLVCVCPAALADYLSRATSTEVMDNSYLQRYSPLSGTTPVVVPTTTEELEAPEDTEPITETPDKKPDTVPEENDEKPAVDEEKPEHKPSTGDNPYTEKPDVPEGVGESNPKTGSELPITAVAVLAAAIMLYGTVKREKHVEH